MQYIKKNNTLNFTNIIGLLLIVSALSIWTYSIIELKGNELVIANQNTPIEQVWRAQGALQWWENFYSTTVIPATTILILSGIATMLSPQLHTSFNQQSGFNQFKEKLEEALKKTM